MFSLRRPHRDTYQTLQQCQCEYSGCNSRRWWRWSTPITHTHTHTDLKWWRPPTVCVCFTTYDLTYETVRSSYCTRCRISMYFLHRWNHTRDNINAPCCFSHDTSAAKTKDRWDITSSFIKMTYCINIYMCVCVVLLLSLIHTNE